VFRAGACTRYSPLTACRPRRITTLRRHKRDARRDHVTYDTSASSYDYRSQCSVCLDRFVHTFFRFITFKRIKNRQWG